MAARPRRRSGVSLLVLGYVALVVYASLYPFAPWEWPAGLTVGHSLRLDWPRYWSPFDVVANAVGYLPLGGLAFAAAWRSGWPGWRAGAVAAAGPALLAYVLEVAQRFVALRVPSLADWALNSGGALAGVALGAAAARLGWLERWGEWRERWFLPQAGGALALLALWPLGLLFPLPAPLAQGRLLPPLLAALEAWVNPWLGMPLSLGSEASALDRWLASLLGVLSPCLLLLAVARPGWQRAAQLLSVLLVGAGMTTLATTLSFGPANAWAWLTPATALALLGGLGLALGVALLPARAAMVLALPVLSGQMALVAHMDPDPFLLLHQQRWELGPQVQLYGLLEWLGWLWPLLALAWLVFGLSRGGEPRIAPFARPRRR